MCWLSTWCWIQTDNPSRKYGIHHEYTIEAAHHYTSSLDAAKNGKVFKVQPQDLRKRYFLDSSADRDRTPPLQIGEIASPICTPDYTTEGSADEEDRGPPNVSNKARVYHFKEPSSGASSRSSSATLVSPPRNSPTDDVPGQALGRREDRVGPRDRFREASDQSKRKSVSKQSKHVQPASKAKQRSESSDNSSISESADGAVRAADAGPVHSARFDSIMATLKGPLSGFRSDQDLLSFWQVANQQPSSAKSKKADADYLIALEEFVEVRVTVCHSIQHYFSLLLVECVPRLSGVPQRLERLQAV